MHAEDLHRGAAKGAQAPVRARSTGVGAGRGGCCLSPGWGETGAAHREQMGHRLERPVSEQSCGRTSF